MNAGESKAKQEENGMENIGEELGEMACFEGAKCFEKELFLLAEQEGKVISQKLGWEGGTEVEHNHNGKDRSS